MKIGIIAYRQYPYVSANTSIAYTIGEQLKVLGHEIVFIGFRQDSSQNSVAEYKGIPVRFFNARPISDYRTKFAVYVRRIAGEDKCYSFLADGLRNIVREEGIDAVLCCVAPIDDAFIVKQANLSIPCFLYQMDPYFSLGGRIDGKKRKLFIETLDSFCHVFTTELLFREYETASIFRPGLFEVVGFPLVRKPVNLQKNQENTGKKVLLFAGTLYDDIRPPHILIELKNAVGDKADVVFCGGFAGVDKTPEFVNAGITCKGNLSKEKAYLEMKNADALVNIGNIVPNQMSSKLVQYISFCKPIINVTQIEDDPGEFFLSRYPKALNIRRRDLLSRADEIVRFVDCCDEAIFAFEDIEKLYIECTPKFVAGQILTSMMRVR